MTLCCFRSIQVTSSCSQVLDAAVEARLKLESCVAGSKQPQARPSVYSAYHMSCVVLGCAACPCLHEDDFLDTDESDEDSESNLYRTTDARLAAYGVGADSHLVK